MMRCTLTALMLAAVAASPAVSIAAPAAVAAAPKTKAAYKIEVTDLGTLLDDPASKVILMKHIPDVVGNPQIEMGRGMTLAQLQQYASDQITAEKLAEIQKEFDAAKPG